MVMDTYLMLDNAYYMIDAMHVDDESWKWLYKIKWLDLKVEKLLVLQYAYGFK